MSNKRPILSKRDLDFIDQSIAISDTPATIEHATFMFSPLCQLGPPKSSIIETSFNRSCGKMHLSIHDGTNRTISEIPFGTATRLIMAYICSYAVRFKTSKIDFGHSAAEFMRRIGLASTGGKNGSLTSIKSQLFNLRLCSIDIRFETGRKSIFSKGQFFMTT